MKGYPPTLPHRLHHHASALVTSRRWNYNIEAIYLKFPKLYVFKLTWQAPASALIEAILFMPFVIEDTGCRIETKIWQRSPWIKEYVLLSQIPAFDIDYITRFHTMWACEVNSYYIDENAQYNLWLPKHHYEHQISLPFICNLKYEKFQ